MCYSKMTQANSVKEIPSAPIRVEAKTLLFFFLPGHFCEGKKYKKERTQKKRINWVKGRWWRKVTKKERSQPPERFELSTPGLQDQCSNPWATEAKLNLWSKFLNLVMNSTPVKKKKKKKNSTPVKKGCFILRNKITWTKQAKITFYHFISFFIGSSASVSICAIFRTNDLWRLRSG